MLELSSPEFVKLETPHFPHHWFRDVPEGWAVSFLRPVDADELRWGFYRDNFEGLPRGYENSVTQRTALWKEIYDCSDIAVVQDEDEFLLVTPAFDGEPILSYLRRSNLPLGAPLYSILLDVVRSLSRLTASPRLLSSIAWEDVFVSRYSAVKLNAKFCPIFSMLREESAQGDFQIARYWAGVIASLLVASADKWEKEFADYDPLGSKAFRSLLKAMDKGREISLTECFTELESILLVERESTKFSADRFRFVWGQNDFPSNALANCLLASYQEAFPDKVPLLPDRLRLRTFSSFVVPSGLEANESTSCSCVLPPEGWFEQSFIDPVNRRLAVPFLKSHPNFTRVRSILCDDGFTALLGDPGGIPIVALFEIRDGITAGEVLRLGEKIGRAFSQFESTDFSVELHSPWQLEIHAVEPKHAELLLSEWHDSPMEEWPAWDVKVRVERPAESFLPDCRSEIAWNKIKSRLGGKEFPALMVWMLEWKRLTWAAAQNTIDSEPLSWDQDMNALFVATTEFYESGNQAHRIRFLELISEGIQDS